MDSKDILLLQDEAMLRWSFLEDERDACVVVSERMELIYVNTTARSLMPDGWFGKRCFEVLPVAGEICAFYCPKIRAISEAAEIVYCEESVCTGGNDCSVFGVGLIPLGPGSQDRGRAVPVLRRKEGFRDESQFKVQLLDHAKNVQKRIVASIVGAS